MERRAWSVEDGAQSIEHRIYEYGYGCGCMCRGSFFLPVSMSVRMTWFEPQGGCIKGDDGWAPR